MGPRKASRLVRSGSAAYQAAWILVLTALTTLLALITDPDRWHTVGGFVAVLLVLAGLMRVLPPVRGSGTTVALSVLVLLSVGGSAYLSGERAMAAAPGFVLCFAWMGLHQRPRAVLVAVPFAAVVYASALVGAHTPGEDIGSVVVLMPIAGMVGALIAQKVSDLKLAEAEIKAEERWRAAIMATLAHDIRAPLTSITGVLEVLAEDPETPAPSRPLLDAAERQASRILRLATGLLEIERVDQGRLRLDMYDVELIDLLREILRSQPTLEVDLDIEPGLSVWADPERLEQIIVNLLGNATRHGGPPIVFTARSVDDQVQMSVRDHGHGVPAGAVSGLFDRLGQTGGSADSVGLGLWIVRILCDAHGGSVAYEDADPGARFVVSLPRGPALVELRLRGNKSLPIAIS